MKSFLRHLARNEDGGMMAEAALIFPVLISIGMGGIDASYMLIQNHKLESQLSAAANFLSKSEFPENHESTARQLAVTGSPDGSSKAIIKGWSAEDINISYLTTSNTYSDYRNDGDVRTVQVSSTLDYGGFGILSSILPQAPQLTANVQERIVGGGR